MIEFLLALGLFATSVAALASAQLTARRAVFEAQQEVIAGYLVQGIVERILANPGAGPNYLAEELGDGSEAEPGVSCTLVDCSPAAMATFDLAQFEAALLGSNVRYGERTAPGLSEPRACIYRVGDTLAVTLNWRGMVAGASPDSDPCAISGQGLYDDPAGSAGDDRLRRQLTRQVIAVATP